MGCGASSKSPAVEPVASENSDLRSIIVWGAENLRDADDVTTSDSYCVARVGNASSKWSEKHRGTGRRSEPVADATSPKWNMAFTVDVADMKDPEVHVRIYDKDLLSDDDFLGEVVIPLKTLTLAEQKIPVSGGGKGKGQVALSTCPPTKLKEMNMKHASFFEEMGPIPPEMSIDVKDIDGSGPLILGTGPGLPEALQGIFWLTKQGTSSALASLGGPSKDGGGCSIGQLVNNRLKVRVSGDRVWAFAEPAKGFVSAIDLVYHFVFDDSTNPTRCQIYPEAKNLDVILTAEWILDFEMELAENGDERFPGSVVWKRPSSILGKEVKSAEYDLVQVIDGKGQRIEPAWGKFVEYQNSSEAGSSPGKVFIRKAA